MDKSRSPPPIMSRDDNVDPLPGDLLHHGFHRDLVPSESGFILELHLDRKAVDVLWGGGPGKSW